MQIRNLFRIIFLACVIMSLSCSEVNGSQSGVFSNEIPLSFESDQMPIETDPQFITELKESMQEQLLSLINSECGWDFGNTPKAVVALSLGNESFFNSNMMSNLVRKQLYLEIALIFAKKHRQEELTKSLVHYTNALISICEDPYDFHQFNLVKKIKHIQATSDYEEALIMLTLCNANHHLSKNNTLKLHRILETIPSLNNADALAIAIMSSVCNQQFLQNAYDISYLHEPLRRIKALQQPDGSFGNVYTTALMIQALISVGDFGTDWNFLQAIKYIKSNYEENGFHSNVMAYYFVLPVLNFKSMAYLNTINCIDRERNICKENTFSNIQYQSNNDTQHINTITYSLKCDSCEFRNSSISTVVMIQEGKSLLDVMKSIAYVDERFNFSFKNSSFGPFIQSIGDLENDVNNNIFWMIYVWSQSLNNYEPVYAGVSEIHPKDSDHYMFWYKKL